MADAEILFGLLLDIQKKRFGERQLDIMKILVLWKELEQRAWIIQTRYKISIFYGKVRSPILIRNALHTTKTDSGREASYELGVMNMISLAMHQKIWLAIHASHPHALYKQKLTEESFATSEHCLSQWQSVPHTP